MDVTVEQTQSSKIEGAQVENSEKEHLLENNEKCELLQDQVKDNDMKNIKAISECDIKVLDTKNEHLRTEKDEGIKVVPGYSKSTGNIPQSGDQTEANTLQFLSLRSVSLQTRSSRGYVKQTNEHVTSKLKSSDVDLNELESKKQNSHISKGNSLLDKSASNTGSSEINETTVKINESDNVHLQYPQDPKANEATLTEAETADSKEDDSTDGDTKRLHDKLQENQDNISSKAVRFERSLSTSSLPSVTVADWGAIFPPLGGLLRLAPSDSSLNSWRSMSRSTLGGRSVTVSRSSLRGSFGVVNRSTRYDEDTSGGNFINMDLAGFGFF